MTIICGPETNIGNGPAEGSLTNVRNANFTYSSSTSGVSFQCSLDGVAYAACAASGKSYSNLAAGTHTFAVKAVNPQGLTDPTPATRSWTIDLTAPDTSVVSGVSGLTNGTSQTFTASGSADTARFECRLDSAAYKACANATATYANLADDTHTFSVRAIDGAGNVDATPATRAFEVARCTISGTAGDNTLTATSKADVICGFDGRDIINGGGGADIVFGGPGNDEITTGSGNDRVLGEAGNDSIRTNAGSDWLDGGIGTDTCDGGTQPLLKSDTALSCETQLGIP